MEHSFRTAAAESPIIFKPISPEMEPLAASELGKLKETCGFSSGKLQNFDTTQMTEPIQNDFKP